MFFLPGGIPPGAFGKGGGKGGVDDEDDAEEPSEVDNSRLYDLLGVDKDASSTDIKKAYHKMAKTHHPDKGGDPDAFKELQRAFEVLSDPEKRQTYDRFGEEGLHEDKSPAGQDFFSQIFGRSRAPGRGRGQRPRTKDVVQPIWVTLEELYIGVTRPVPIVRKVVDESAEVTRCDACDGRGHLVEVIRLGPMVQQVQKLCSHCRGAGSATKLKTHREVLQVFVDKGTPEGHKIIVHGKADEAPGAEPGDVVVVVRLQEHGRFLRKEADLYMQVELSLAQALAGFRIVVSHLDGRKLVVRSKPGEVLCPGPGGLILRGVRGGGMPIFQDPFNFGNLFLAITLRFPEALTQSTAKQLQMLLGPEESPEPEDLDEADVEEAVAEDLDPIESAKQSRKATTQAYDEDEDAHPHGIECKHQ